MLLDLADTNRDSYCHGDTDRHANANGHSDANAHTDTNCDCYPDGHDNCDPNTYVNGNRADPHTGVRTYARDGLSEADSVLEIDDPPEAQAT